MDREVPSATTVRLPADPRRAAFWTSMISRPTRTGTGLAV